MTVQLEQELDELEKQRKIDEGMSKLVSAFLSVAEQIYLEEKAKALAEENKHEQIQTIMEFL